MGRVGKIKSRARAIERVLVGLLLLGIVFPSFVCTSAHGYSHQTNWLFHQVEDFLAEVSAPDHDHHDEHHSEHNHDEPSSPHGHDHDYTDTHGMEVGNVSSFKTLKFPTAIPAPDFDVTHGIVEFTEFSPFTTKAPCNSLHLRRSTVLIV